MREDGDIYVADVQNSQGVSVASEMTCTVSDGA